MLENNRANESVYSSHVTPLSHSNSQRSFPDSRPKPQSQLESYVTFKQEYDVFYAEYVQMARQIDFDQILEINLQSNIRL